MKFSKLLIASVAGGLLLWLSWPIFPTTLFIFVSLTPLLYIEDNAKNGRTLFLYSYILFLLWNLLTTWWVCMATVPGGIAANVANALIMCIPILLFHVTKMKLGKVVGYASLIIYWITYEYIHHNWELSWPWLTLGNVFATHTQWVQWYEITGVTGGSIWVLLVNILVYNTYISYKNYGRGKKYVYGVICIILSLFIPIMGSTLLGSNRASHYRAFLDKDLRKNIVIVQPNVNPYTEKFSLPVSEILNKLIVLSEKKMDEHTSLLVWPETAIPAQVWEDDIKYHPDYQPLWAFLKRHPFCNILTGIDSYKRYPLGTKPPITARIEPGGQFYYDAFNTAAFFDADTTINLYHKGKLVPGVETLPSFLNVLGKWFESFGGISGTLGRDSHRKVFMGWDEYYKAAPVICYESIYSDYITEYIRQGANVLAIITNDGWWGNTPGYKQHENYARLRAIESRKWIARSANTGISCFIDPLGNITQSLPWDTEGALKFNVPIENHETFFVKNGDYISKIAIYISIILLLWTLIYYLKGWKRND